MRKISSVKFNLPVGHLEILADGQYFVAEGIHPVTKQKYTWHNGSSETIPVKDLPLITEEQTHKIVAWFEERARSVGAVEQEKKHRPSESSSDSVSNSTTNNNHYQQNPVGLKPYWCINLLRRFDPSCKRKKWIKIGMALHHEFRGSPEAFKIWDDWSAKSKTKYVPGETAYQWQSFDRGYSDRPITGATLLYYSKSKGKISSKAPPKPKRLPLNVYCQKAITVLQKQHSKSSPWSLRRLLVIFKKHMKIGRPTVEKIIKNLLQNELINDNSDQNFLCQYTLTEKGKRPCLPEKKENKYAV